MTRKIFLAHAREDKVQVRKLYDDLKAHGLDPWLDKVDLVPGQIWKDEIPKAIRQAEVFLACLSSQSVGKVGYVQNEFRLALSAFGERPPGSIYLIPVRLDECDVPDLQIPDLALSFKDIHWVDLWQEGGFERLVGAIKRAFAGNAPTSPSEAPQPSAQIPKAVAESQEETTSEGGAGTTRLTEVATIEHTDLEMIQDAEFAPELVVLPKGEFLMGSPDNDPKIAEREKPEHLVRIDYHLAVGCYAVTFDEWDRFSEDVEWHRSKHMAPYKPHDDGWGRGKRPVINVTWEDVQGYILWLSEKTGFRYRLLSEAEWEYACRAGTTSAYHTGPTLTHYDANFEKEVGKTVEVGSYSPNAWKLHDMHGNVWEWVEDCWNDTYEGAPNDGVAWTNGDCSLRVLRGGSWGNRVETLRSACRGWDRPGGRGNRFGFRVARTFP